MFHLSEAKFCVAYYMAAVGETDTKLVLHNLLGRSSSRSDLEVTQLFVSGLYLKNYLINTYAVSHACSLCLGRVSRTKLGGLAKCSRSFILFPVLKAKLRNKC